MKRVVGSVLLLTLAACGSEGPQDPTLVPKSDSESSGGSGTASGRYKISGPYTHDNLAVFLLHDGGAPLGTDDYLMLDEAITADVLRISESSEDGTVNRLEFENVGDKAVYLQAGDTLKGGKQDRTIADDRVLPPGSGKQSVLVFCVEPGRWSSRASGEYFFTAATVVLATNEQKLAARLYKKQSKIWSAGAAANEGLARETGAAKKDSYVLASEGRQVAEKTRSYMETLSSICTGKEDLVGMAFAVNGKINFADAYTTRGLFRKLWPKLLRAAAVEALSKRAGRRHGRATAKDVRWLLEEPMKGSERAENTAPNNRLQVNNTGRAVRFRSEWKGFRLRDSWAKVD